MVIKHDKTLNGLLKVLAALEPMALQDVFNPAVERLDHAICPLPHWGCEAMLEAEIASLSGSEVTILDGSFYGPVTD